MKLLVIDIQKGITDERLYNFEHFIQNTVRIINAARQNNVEVIYVQHDDGEGSGFSVGDDGGVHHLLSWKTCCLINTAKSNKYNRRLVQFCEPYPCN